MLWMQVKYFGCNGTNLKEIKATKMADFLQDHQGNNSSSRWNVRAIIITAICVAALLSLVGAYHYLQSKETLMAIALAVSSVVTTLSAAAMTWATMNKNAELKSSPLSNAKESQAPIIETKTDTPV
jgi:uncharacterized membrane protein